MRDLTESEITTLTDKLVEQKGDLEERLQIGNKEDGNGMVATSLKESIGELSSYDNHPGDLGTEVFERSRDLAINEKLTSQLDQVNHALAQIKSGEYGTCEQCGANISFERLEVIPYTAFCIEHTPDQTVSEHRPVEEEVMTKPPTGAGENRQRNSGHFDEADAWRTLEKYGNSDSPAISAKRDISSYNNMTVDEK